MTIISHPFPPNHSRALTGPVGYLCRLDPVPTLTKVMNLGTILFKGGVSFEDGFAGAEGGAISNTDTLM